MTFRQRFRMACYHAAAGCAVVLFATALGAGFMLLARFAGPKEFWPIAYDVINHLSGSLIMAFSGGAITALAAGFLFGDSS